jgi:hypothetical protein
MPGRPKVDTELLTVAAEIRKLDPQGSRTAHVLRDSLDQLYDGQRTRRYRWDQLYHTEKTKGGELVEINLHREFKFQDGEKLDFQIAGTDVDCKYSQTLGGWMIPPEAHDHLCLLVWADDPAACWSMGAVRTTFEHLNTGGNRDRKATLNQRGRDAITWLFNHAPLPPNILLQLNRRDVDRIMGLPSGVKRVNELFRVALGMRVGRAVVATVGEQVDYMKRVRYNGGARTFLQPEGIIILGQYKSHVVVAQSLGVPIPGPGESVSVRVTPAAVLEPGVAEICGGFWRIAKHGDTVVKAPLLPEV